MKNDFCVEEMMKTQFPQLIIDEFARGGGQWGDYDAREVDEWFKRCITDFPLGSHIKHTKFDEWVPPTDYQYRHWFEKWFSQFIEKGEES